MVELFEVTCSKVLKCRRYVKVFLVMCDGVPSCCGVHICYEYRVADYRRARADSNMHSSPWLDDGYAILAHSRYADGNYDSALNWSRQYA